MNSICRNCSSLAVALALLVGGALAGELPVGQVKPSAPVKDRVATPYGGPLPAGALVRIGTPRFMVEHEVKAIAFSPDGKYLAVGGNGPSPGYSARMWVLSTGQVLHERLGRLGLLNGLAFSPSGNVFLILDSTIRVAPRIGHPVIAFEDLGTGKHFQEFDAGQHTTYAVAVSPDGKLFASSHPDETIRLWDAATGKEVRRLQGQERPVWSVAFSADSKRLVASTGPIRVWDVASGKVIAQLGNAGLVNLAVVQYAGIAVSADGKKVVSLSPNGTARLWDVATSSDESISVEGGASCAAFSPDGQVLAVVSSRGGKNPLTQKYKNARTYLYLWNLATHKEPRRVFLGEALVKTLAFSPDCTILATDSGFPLHHYSVRLWDVATGKELPQFQGHEEAITSVAYSPDGKSLASASLDQTVRIWNSATGKEMLKLDGHRDRTTSVAFSPDGKTLASGGGDMMVHLWATETGKELRRFELADEDSLGIYLALSPNGKHLAAGRQAIRLWDLTTGKQLYRLEGLSVPLAFSQDGKLLSGGSVYRVATGKRYRQLNGALSPDGRSLAAPAEQKVVDFMRMKTIPRGIALLNVATKREVRRFEVGKGDFGPVAFSSDGKLLAAVVEPEIHVWEVATGVQRCCFSGHRGTISTIAFAPDSRTLASGAADSTILIWDLCAKQTPRK